MFFYQNAPASQQWVLTQQHRIPQSQLQKCVSKGGALEIGVYHFDAKIRELYIF